MYGTKKVKQLSIDSILEQITEYDIFKYYVGKSFKIGTIKSPFRKDNHPSFDIFPSRNTVRKMMFKDHATGETGSCFDFVMKKYGLTFSGALRLIDSDFNLGLSSLPRPKNFTMGHIGEKTGVDVSGLEPKADIRVVRRKWNSTTDKYYWSKYGLTVDILRLFRVSPISAVRVNYKWFRFRNNEPVYCYHFGEYIYKILQPSSDTNKWLTNASKDILQGWHMLPETGELCVITKSMKDVMVFYAIGIPAIACQSEGTIPEERVILELKDRFDLVVSNYDWDYRGIVSANKMKKMYDIPPYMFSPGWDVKDPSDFVEVYGLSALSELIDDISKGVYSESDDSLPY